MLLVHACGRCHLNFEVIPVSLLGVLLCIETISIDFSFVCNSNSYYKKTKNPHPLLSAGFFCAVTQLPVLATCSNATIAERKGKDTGISGYGWEKFSLVQPAVSVCPSLSAAGRCRSRVQPQDLLLFPAQPHCSGDKSPIYSAHRQLSLWHATDTLPGKNKQQWLL